LEEIHDEANSREKAATVTPRSSRSSGRTREPSGGPGPAPRWSSSTTSAPGPGSSALRRWAAPPRETAGSWSSHPAEDRLPTQTGTTTSRPTQGSPLRWVPRRSRSWRTSWPTPRS